MYEDSNIVNKAIAAVDDTITCAITFSLLQHSDLRCRGMLDGGALLFAFVL